MLDKADPVCLDMFFSFIHTTAFSHGFPKYPMQFMCILILTGLLSLMTSHASAADPLLELAGSLPRQVNGWSAEGQDRLFDEKTIFDYIDGSGEVYRAYNMRQCLSRVYAKTDGPAIVLDVFDMRTAADAFGVFTHDTEGMVISIGQDGRWRPGWLNFWKDRFFVSITVQEENVQAFEAVRELGRQVARSIPKEGSRPDLLKQLPSQGMEEKSIRFLHHPIILSYHFYLSDENLLNLSPRTDVVLADYRHGSGHARLLIVQYPDAVEARKASAAFMAHYLPDADPSGSARLENGKWSSARLDDRYLVVVLEADSREVAENLMRLVR